MRFATQLADYSAADIIAAIGCPRGTAYDWKDGRREPPEWQQPHWLALIQSAHKKKANKTQKPMTPARKSKGKGGQ